MKNKYLIIFIISILLVCGSYYYLYTTKQEIDNIITIDAKVTAIDSETGQSTIEYKIDEEDYKTTIPTSDKTVLDENVQINVNKNNPGTVTTVPSIIIPICILLFTILVFFISSYLLIKDLITNGKKNSLKKEGIYIEANISEVILNTNAKQIKGTYPYRIRCLYTNPTDQRQFIFESEDLYFNVNELIQKYNITKLPIYVNKINYKKYYIDIDYITNKEKM